MKFAYINKRGIKNMYTEIKDNIFNTTVKYIMHQVNAQGVMGAGIAKAIKDDISYKDFM